MRQRTLNEALGTSRDNDLLEDETGRIWTVRGLICAFVEGNEARLEDILSGLTLDSPVYIEGGNIHLVSDDGYIGPAPVFQRITPPENPYHVLAIDHRYRIIFMENEGQWRYHLVNGQPFYQRKWAAYRRKEALNIGWRKQMRSGNGIAPSRRKQGKRLG
jgi:hypothetical protein